MRHYDLYQKLRLQFDVLLMMGAIDTRNMYSNFAVNKDLHTVASRWIWLIYVCIYLCLWFTLSLDSRKSWGLTPVEFLSLRYLSVFAGNFSIFKRFFRAIFSCWLFQSLQSSATLIKTLDVNYSITYTVRLLLFCAMTNEYTINWHILVWIGEVLTTSSLRMTQLCRNM